MKLLIFLFFFCLTVSSPADAQSILAINYRPVGVLLRPSCGMSLSMGGTGIAVADEHHLMSNNPANLGTFKKTVFTSLLSAEYLKVNDYRRSTNFLSINPQQVGFGFQLGPVGTIAFALEGRSDASVKYRAYYDKSQIGNTPAGLDAVELAFSSNGGITVWQAAWGYSILPSLYAGISYERTYLSYDASIIKTTRGVSGAARSVDSLSLVWRGNGLKTGIMVSWYKFVLGVVGEYFLPSEANFSKGVYWGENGGVLTNSIIEEIPKMKLPPSMAAGVSYQPRDEVLLAFDALVVFWNHAWWSDIISKTAEGTTMSFNLGGQYIPAPNILSPRYWETIRYRSGIRYQKLPSARNWEFFGTMGLGLPLKNSGLFDVVMEIGVRKDENYPNYREEIVRLGIGISSGRKWTKSSRGIY